MPDIQRPLAPSQRLVTTAFGELAVESKSPQVQIKFPYKVIDDLAQSLTNKPGSTVTTADGNAIITAAGVAESFGQIRSRKVLRYGPGQGGLWMGTCIFSPGVANSSQILGSGDDDQGYFWGYNETEFGILRRNGGSLEMMQITITAGATNTGNITFTLDGGAVVVGVTAGDTIAEVTEKIVAAEPSFFNAGRGWEVHTDENISVEFISFVAEHATGTFSFVDTDATGVTASAFTTVVTGIVPTDSWIALDSGNFQIIDPLDGTGPSRFIINPAKGNVFYIRFQYLGYGAIEYGVENPTTGDFIAAVRLQYSNANLIPSLENSDNPITLIAKTEAGYTGDPIVMKTASIAGFSEGERIIGGIRRSVSATKNITTTESVLLILHNEIDFNNKINKISVFPDLMLFGTESGKTTIVRIIREPTRIDGGAPLIDIETDVSVMQYSPTGTSINGGRELISLVLGPNSNAGAILNLIKEEITINPKERLVVTARLTGGAASDVTASFSWNEGV